MATTKEKTEEAPQSARLYRSETNKVIAGVAGGLGDYFEIDPTIIRIIFMLLTIFGGSGILIYIILWLIMPTESRISEESKASIHQNVAEIKDKAQTFAHDLKVSSRTKSDSRHWWAITIVILGFIFLMENFGLLGSLDLEKLWPVILIVFGLLILTRK